MKTLILFFALFLPFTTYTAEAATVWNYKIESNGPVQGGKVKIILLGGGNIRFKYKLETSVGYKEDWIPYKLPAQLFDPGFYASLSIGEQVQLGDYVVTRETQSAFLATSSEGKFRIYPRSSGGAWRRIEFTVRAGVTVRLNGNLMAVTNE
jgi:hypothetical protein